MNVLVVEIGLSQSIIMIYARNAPKNTLKGANIFVTAPKNGAIGAIGVIGKIPNKKWRIGALIETINVKQLYKW